MKYLFGHETWGDVVPLLLKYFEDGGLRVLLVLLSFHVSGRMDRPANLALSCH